MVTRTGRKNLEGIAAAERGIPWIASDTVAKKVLAKDENTRWMFFARYEDSGGWVVEGKLLRQECEGGEEIVSNLLNASGTMAILIGIRERKIIELASDF